MACQACYGDARCTGWRSLDNRTAELFNETLLRNTSVPPGKTCVGAFRHHERHGGSGTNWFGIADLGGCTKKDGCSNLWYSTTEQAQCKGSAPLGTGGCSWRLVETRKYANATCVDSKADSAVEKHGSRCFDKCPQPLNHTTDCYLDCYRNTLMGDASQNITAIKPEAIIEPWKKALAEDDPDAGGCPPVKPSPGAALDR
jgi:hypothetical protein